MEARILAVADVVEAMASHRPYRPALGIEKALEEISQKRGTIKKSIAQATVTASSLLVASIMWYWGKPSHCWNN